MKKILLISCATSSLLLAGALDNVNLRNYKVVEGSYSNAYAEGSATVKDGNQGQTSYDINGKIYGKTIQTTASYAWGLNGIANVDISKGSKKDESSVKGYDAFASANFDKYFFNDDTFFGYGIVDLGYRKQKTADKADDPYAKIGAGIGYGRMYDATPLAKSLRIIEDLVKYNIVSSSVSQKAAFDLARIVDIKDEFKSKYGASEYKAYWYGAMEKVLQANGALTNNALGAFGVARITEVLDNEKVSARFHGWKARIGFGKILSNWDGKSTDTTVDLGFDYGLPIGLNTQITDNARVSTVLNDSDLQFIFNNKLTHSYEFSNNIDWVNIWEINYEKYDKADDVTKNILSSSFEYKMGDQLSYYLTLELNKATSDDDWNKKLLTGIKYRLK